MQFHGLKIFFSTFELPQVVSNVPFYAVFNFEPNLIFFKTPPSNTVLMNLHYLLLTFSNKNVINSQKGQVDFLFQLMKVMELKILKMG